MTTMMTFSDVQIAYAALDRDNATLRRMVEEMSTVGYRLPKDNTLHVLATHMCTFCRAGDVVPEDIIKAFGQNLIQCNRWSTSGLFLVARYQRLIHGNDGLLVHIAKKMQAKIASAKNDPDIQEALGDIAMISIPIRGFADTEDDFFEVFLVLEQQGVLNSMLSVEPYMQSGIDALLDAILLFSKDQQFANSLVANNAHMKLIHMACDDGHSGAFFVLRKLIRRVSHFARDIIYNETEDLLIEFLEDAESDITPVIAVFDCFRVFLKLGMPGIVKNILEEKGIIELMLYHVDSIMACRCDSGDDDRSNFFRILQDIVNSDPDICSSVHDIFMEPFIANVMNGDPEEVNAGVQLLYEATASIPAFFEEFPQIAVKICKTGTLAQIDKIMRVCVWILFDEDGPRETIKQHIFNGLKTLDMISSLQKFSNSEFVLDPDSVLHSNPDSDSDSDSHDWREDITTDASTLLRYFGAN